MEGASYINLQNILDEVAETLKLQASSKKNYFTDIIEIKPQPGLTAFENSNAGSFYQKYNDELVSLGTTLLPHSIKLNFIQPGNVFKSDVWKHPENGLFKKILASGAIREANCLTDVKHYYEKRLPLGRSCETKDILKALYYLIEQEYASGQLLNVTGGF